MMTDVADSSGLDQELARIRAAYEIEKAKISADEFAWCEKKGWNRAVVEASFQTRLRMFLEHDLEQAVIAHREGQI